MERKVINAQPADYRELLNFERLVFRVPFRIIMPKLYNHKEYCTKVSRVIKQDGKIIGAYSLCPNEIITSAGKLKSFGVASVAVSKKHRNEGLMSLMLKDADKLAGENGADISFLGGLRHRYERFGYIPCGERYIFDVTSHYARHTKVNKKYTFTPLSKRPDLSEGVYEIFEKQRIHFKRSAAEFEEIAATWRDRCFVILSKNSLCGYLVTDNFRKEVREINITEETELSDVMLSFLSEFSKDSVSVWLFPWQKEMISQAHIFGEHIKIQLSASIKFYNFKKVIEVMMNTKLKEKTLCEGKLAIKLGEESLLITVKDGKCEVTEATGAPEISLSYYDAMITLTTHHGCDSHPLLRDWSPMCEIAIPSGDKV